jgi:hypothetical protein
MQSHNDTVIDPAYQNAQPSMPPTDAPPRIVPPPTAARRDYFDDPRRKSPVLALVLSAMPGLGQCYVGYYHQGFTNALIIASLIALIGSSVAHQLEPLFGLFLAFYWLFNIVDAWRRAVFYNNALAGIGPATLPEEFSVVKGRGSLGGGLALMGLGVVLLSNTLFQLPLEWVEQWWPVAFIAVGAWLAYPAFKEKTGKTE